MIINDGVHQFAGQVGRVGMPRGLGGAPHAERPHLAREAHELDRVAQFADRAALLECGPDGDPATGRTRTVLDTIADNAANAAIVLGGRLIMHLFVWSRKPAAVTKGKPATDWSDKLGKYVAPALLIIGLAIPFLTVGDKRSIDLAIYVMTYIMLAWGLNIVVGLAGLLDRALGELLVARTLVLGNHRIDDLVVKLD